MNIDRTLALSCAVSEPYIESGLYGPPAPGTLGWLILSYQNEPVSTYHELRYQVRVRRDYSLRMIVRRCGGTSLANIQAKTILEWYSEVSARKTKIATGHSFVNVLRTLVAFGVLVLENRECERIAGILTLMHFAVGKPRSERLTIEQVEAICAMAHKMAHPSIALAQALQFECMLRQKDIVGEVIPISEPGIGLPHKFGTKWMHGLLWGEIDEHLILRHVTSKTGKLIEFDLRLAPLVMREFSILANYNPGKKSGPVIICETTGRPWLASEYRRKWRIIADAAGIPKNVRNQDSRAGGITEAVEAGAQVDQIRQTATHSSANTTQRYIRGGYQESSSQVMNARVARRQKREG